MQLDRGIKVEQKPDIPFADGSTVLDRRAKGLGTPVWRLMENLRPPNMMSEERWTALALVEAGRGRGEARLRTKAESVEELEKKRKRNKKKSLADRRCRRSGGGGGAEDVGDLEDDGELPSADRLCCFVYYYSTGSQCTNSYRYLYVRRWRAARRGNLHIEPAAALGTDDAPA